MSKLVTLKTIVVTLGASATQITSSQIYATAASIEPHQDNPTAVCYVGDSGVDTTDKDGAYVSSSTPVRLAPKDPGDFFDLRSVYLAGTNTEKFTVSYWVRQLEGAS